MHRSWNHLCWGNYQFPFLRVSDIWFIANESRTWTLKERRKFRRIVRLLRFVSHPSRPIWNITSLHRNRLRSTNRYLTNGGLSFSGSNQSLFLVDLLCHTCSTPVNPFDLYRVP